VSVVVVTGKDVSVLVDVTVSVSVGREVSRS
jgi:hypothetical protein